MKQSPRVIALTREGTRGEDLKRLTVERRIIGLLGKTQTLEKLSQVQWNLKESMGYLGRRGALYLCRL